MIAIDLTELQSFTQNKPQITPIHSVLVCFPLVFVHCNSGLCHVVILFSIMIDEHWINGRKEHHMSPFLDVFSTKNQSRSDDRARIVGAFNMVDLLGEVVR